MFVAQVGSYTVLHDGKTHESTLFQSVRVVVSGVAYANIYSARSTIEYGLQLNYEFTFVPISVELV